MESHVIDVHAHLGASALLYLSSMQRFASPQELIKLMDATGIDKAVISPIPGYATPEGIKNTRAQNDKIAEAVRRYPKRFPVGLATLEPRQGEEKCLEELDRIVKKLKLRGLMFHHVLQGNYLDGPVTYSIAERAAKYKLPLLMHTYPVIEEPFRLENLAEAFPDVTFINSHPATGGESHWEWSLAVSKRRENVLIDTCFMRHFFGVERAVKTIGADRILFGDDLPYYGYDSPSVDLFIVKNVRISEEDREKILWKNAARVFGIKI